MIGALQSVDCCNVLLDQGGDLGHGAEISHPVQPSGIDHSGAAFSEHYDGNLPNGQLRSRPIDVPQWHPPIHAARTCADPTRRTHSPGSPLPARTSFRDRATGRYAALVFRQLPLHLRSVTAHAATEARLTFGLFSRACSVAPYLFTVARGVCMTVGVGPATKRSTCQPPWA